MNVKGELIRWARKRAQLSVNEAAKKIQVKEEKFKSWEQDKATPTHKQLEKIAKKFYVPFGYLFLSDPPEEKLPIPDFRTKSKQAISNPSPELLEVIYDAQRKQNWLREQKINNGEGKVIKTTSFAEQKIVKDINKLLNIKNLRKRSKSKEDFLKSIIDALDEKEFLIIRNGIVINNTRRPLNVDEFKGFALFDEYAPLIFINGKDFKASQIFTVTHELAHLFLGESALDNSFHTEQQCNKIAAEVLLPEKQLREFCKNKKNVDLDIKRIAKDFKISRFVVLIKMKQLNFIRESEFQGKWQEYKSEAEKNEDKKKSRSGNFYANVKFKAGGKNFLSRVLYSTLAGETLYRDAYRLTGLNGKTFDKYYEKAEGVFL